MEEENKSADDMNKARISQMSCDMEIPLNCTSSSPFRHLYDENLQPMGHVHSQRLLTKL